MKKKIHIDFIITPGDQSGGAKLDKSMLEHRRFIGNICRMGKPCKVLSKELGFLTIGDWTTMLEYIEEYKE